MTAYYNEIDPFAADWLENLILVGAIAPGVVDRRSIEDVTPDDLKGFTQVHFFAGIGIWSHALREAGWRDDRRVWTASRPCQPFSAAGKGNGFDDERHLWPALYHLATLCRPDVIFGEQVASKDGLAWLDVVHSDLEATGHAFGALDLCAAGVGAPHIRQRSFWVAHANARQSEQPAGNGTRPGETERGRPFGKPAGRGDVDGMAHAEHDGGRPDEPGRGPNRRTVDGRGGSIMRLGDPSRTGLPEQRGVGRTPLETSVGIARQAPERTDAPVSGLADSPSANIRGYGGNPRSATGESKSDTRAPDGDTDRSASGVVRGRPGPTNGYWGNADWLGCRDGKWRPVESSHVKMVDGATRVVGQGGSDDSSEVPKAKINDPKMQILSGAIGSETMVDGQAGRQRSVRETPLLRPGLHGGGVRRNDQNTQREELPQAIGETTPAELREMREDEPPRASSRREPDEQLRLEFTDIVRLLPSSLARAERENDKRTFGYLSILQQAILSEGSLPHASFAIGAAWESLSQETQDDLRLAFGDPSLLITRPFPLIQGAANRVGRLRGYGNAIVGPLAKIFIETVMEYLDD